MRSVLSVSSKPVLRASQAPPGGLLAHFTAAEQVTYMSIFHATAKRCGSGTPNGDAFACGCGAKPPHYLRLSKVAATIQGRDQALFAKLYRLGINQVSAAILARHDIQTRASAWNSRSSKVRGLGGTAERNSTVFGFVLCTECGDAAPLPLGASSAVPPSSAGTADSGPLYDGESTAPAQLSLEWMPQKAQRKPQPNLHQVGQHGFYSVQRPGHSRTPYMPGWLEVTNFDSVEFRKAVEFRNTKSWNAVAARRLYYACDCHSEVRTAEFHQVAVSV